MKNTPFYYFQLARNATRITPAWVTVLLTLLMGLIGQVIGGVFFVAYLVTKDDNAAKIFEEEIAPEQLLDMANLSSTELGFMLFSSFIFTSLLCVLWIKLFEGRSFASLGFETLRSGLFKFARGGLFAFASMAAIAFGLQGLGMAESTTAQTPSSWLMVWPLIILLIGWTVQASTEEILTRGFLVQTIGAKHGLWVAALISALIFSLAHGANSNSSALFFLNLAGYALFACFYVLREGGLWGICGHHAIWNFTQGNLFGFAVSGERLGADRLMEFTENGPDFITGGATGPEGGLVTTVVLGVSMLILMLLTPPKAEHDQEAAQSVG